MARYYDDYDYEEAYQEQLDKLQEWELERLVAAEKVSCLYRTTTTKSVSAIDGTVLLESQVYPSFTCKKDVPQTKRRRETKPSQKNLNDKNSRRYLIRLACINFGKGDIWATFGWNDDCMPEDMDAARKDIKNFFARVNYRQKKAGKANVKYIYILAFDEHTRPHVHILMSGKGIDRDELEELWGKCDRPNTRRIKPDDNFLIVGLGNYVSRNPHGTKRWCASKNLKKPEKPTRSYSKFRRKKVNKMIRDHEVLREEMERAYPGYIFLDAEVMYSKQLALFYIYARLVHKADSKSSRK